MTTASRRLLPSAVLLCMLCLPMTALAGMPAPLVRETEPVEAQFRGCDSAGWCRFWVESLDPLARTLHRVYPDGVTRTTGNDALAVAVRDRLNAMLASMVHQHKRIVLHDLRELGDGTFAARVTVNESDLASDPILMGLIGEFAPTIR